MKISRTSSFGPIRSALYGALMLMFFNYPAAAFDNRDAHAVVLTLEALCAETGETVYFDEEAADEWFDRDQESALRITEAGFDRESWKDAYDKTLKGFIASIPSGTFDKMNKGFEGAVMAMKEFSDEQKSEAIGEWREQYRKLEKIRIEGIEYAATVGPLSARLERIVQMQ